MAFIFGDSFDHYTNPSITTGSDVDAKWDIHTVGGTIGGGLLSSAAMPPHRIGLSLYCTSAGAYIWKILPTPIRTFIYGAWIQTPSAFAARIITSFYDGAVAHVDIRTDTSGHIVLTRNGTVLATSTNTMLQYTWYHIEFKVSIGDVTGDSGTYGKYEVRVDGTSTGWIPEATDVDTRNGGNATIDRFFILGTTTYIYMQDLYILDDTGSTCNTFLGPSRFAVLPVTGAGNSADFTGNFTDNFENVKNWWGDTIGNRSETNGDIDLFQVADPPSATIHAVQHVIAVRRDPGTPRTVRTKVRIAGTDYDGTTQDVTSTYRFLTEPMDVSPATSSAWTAEELADTEFGYELVS